MKFIAKTYIENPYDTGNLKGNIRFVNKNSFIDIPQEWYKSMATVKGGVLTLPFMSNGRNFELEWDMHKQLSLRTGVYYLATLVSQNDIFYMSKGLLKREVLPVIDGQYSVVLCTKVIVTAELANGVLTLLQSTLPMVHITVTDSTNDSMTLLLTPKAVMPRGYDITSFIKSVIGTALKERGIMVESCTSATNGSDIKIKIKFSAGD